MRLQRLYNNVRFPMSGPSLDNIARIDSGARPMIYRMMRRGLRVDLDHFAKMGRVLTDDMDRITEEVRVMTGSYVNLGSGPQVSNLLFKQLGLKQARPKMTKTGERESVENEVLVAIQHDHPVVPKILNYKEYEKLRGTYVVPMPKLARKVGFGEWRMFPKLGDTRVPSGRLNCIAKGTPIEILRDVWAHPKGIPIEDVKPGDWAYTFDEDLNLTLKQVKWQARTGHRKTVRVYWRGTGGKHTGHLTLTPDHRVLLTSGEYKEARLLERGDRICSLSRGITNYGYERLYASGIGEIPKEHRFVWTTLHNGEIPHHVHHKNKNRRDNRPENLFNLFAPDHLRWHLQTRVFTDEYRKNLRAAYYKTGIGSKTFEERSAYQDRHKLHLTKEWIERELDRFGGHPTKVCKEHGIDYETFQKYMRLHGIRWKVIAQRHKLENNHIVESVHDWLEEDVYDLEIADTHNFIAGELCVHNCKEPNLLAMPNRTKRGRQICEGFITDPGWVYLSVDESQIEPRVVAHRSQDPALMGVYFNEEDIYSDFAIAAFSLKDTRYQDADGWHYPGVDKKTHRFPSKTCILASIYDVTNIGLLEQMPTICKHCGIESKDHTDTACKFSPLWNEENCQGLITSFYQKYPNILTMRKRDHARARKYGYVWDDFGRLLQCIGVKSVLEWVVSAVLRELGNFPIQSTAQGTVKLTMAQVDDDFAAMGLYGDVCNPLLQIHDELLFEVREDMADEIAAHVKMRFEGCVELNVPIKASSAKAANWGAVPK